MFKTALKHLKSFWHTSLGIGESYAILFLMAITALHIAQSYQISSDILKIREDLNQIEASLTDISNQMDSINKEIDSIKSDLSETERYVNLIQEELDLKEESSNKQVSEKDKIVSMVFEIAPQYDISPYMLMAMIERESNYDPKATNGQYKGLLQITERWHDSRMKELGVTDLYDPAGNITVACSYLKDLYDLYEDQEMVLMCYSMDNNKAMNLWRNGQVSVYATAVIERMKELEEGNGEE